eukprot:33424_1
MFKNQSPVQKYLHAMSLFILSPDVQSKLPFIWLLLSSLYRTSQSVINAPSNDTNWSYECGPEFAACQSEIINCPTDANCNIICSGNSGCYHATINWPTNAYGTIACDGPIHQSCFSVNFPVPPPNNDFTFACDADNECGAAEIYCPTNANCHIICNADKACADATIHWSNTQSIISTLTCGQNFTDPCKNINFPPTYSPTSQHTSNPTKYQTNNSSVAPTINPTKQTKGPTTSNPTNPT